MDGIKYVDDLIKEYFFFRGFSKTLSAFEEEQRSDPLNEFQVERVVDALFDHVEALELDRALALWQYLDSKYFSRLDNNLYRTVKRLEVSLKRYFVVQAITRGSNERALQFFREHADILSRSADWQPWFALPLMANPESQPGFEVFFSKDWAEKLHISMLNFMRTIFESVPLPQILLYNVDRQRRRQLEAENMSLQTQNESLRSQLENALLTSKSLSQQLRMMEDSPHVSPAPESSLRAKDYRLAESAAEAGKDADAGAIVSDDEPFTRTPTVRSTQSASYKGHANAVRCMDSAPDGLSFASGGSDRTLRIWTDESFPSNRAANILCDSAVTGVAWHSQNDERVAFGTEKGVVKVWDVETKQMAVDAKVDDSPCMISAMIAHPQNNSFAISLSPADGFGVGKMVYWDSRNAQAAGEVRIDPAGVHALSLSFNHNGSLLAAGGSDGRVRIYDVRTDSAIMAWPAHRAGVSCVRFSEDETVVLTAGHDGDIHEFSLRSVGQIACTHVLPRDSVKRALQHRVGVSLALFAGDRYFISSASGKTPLLFQRGMARALCSIPHEHSEVVTSVSVHAATSLCLSGDSAGTVLASRVAIE